MNSMMTARFDIDNHDQPNDEHKLAEEAVEDQTRSSLDASESDPEEAEQPPRDILSRISSRRSAASWIDPGPPPDGGFTAWTQVVVGHMAIFVTWGYLNSFGVFESYYVSSLGHSFSDVAWIGSVQIFSLFFIGTFSGRALDYGLFRVVFFSGLILQAVGVFTTSVAKTYWQVLLAQGVCSGVGAGLMFTPTVALVSTYFSKNKVVAMGITACGSATGGLVFPAMVKELLPQIGFPWTVRAVAFVQLALNLLAFALLRTRVPPRKTGSLIDWTAFKEPTYVLYVVGMFFAFWATYFSFFYIGSYAEDILGLSYSDSINLIFVLNGTGIIARIAPALVADRWTGPLNLMIPACLVSAVLMFLWPTVLNTGGLYAWAVVYGLFSNAILSLWPATLSTLTKDIQKSGTRIGMGFSVIAFAGLTGPPLAGALIQLDGGNYLYAQMWAGGCLFLGGSLCALARWASSGWNLKVRI